VNAARRPRARHRFALAALARIAAAGAVLALAGCAHQGTAVGAQADRPGEISRPTVDSVTVALWSMDETSGTRAIDSGPRGISGITGIETRTDFGRFGRARVFSRSLDSFVFIPPAPEIEPHTGFTIEAWINMNTFGDYEDTPIAARWVAQTDQRSWLFSVIGRRLVPPVVSNSSPGDHADYVFRRTTGQLLFVFQPAEAGEARAYVSTRQIELGRWMHVAATYDGATIRLWIDGVLDAQYASPGRIRHSEAPLEVGNAVDPRWLSSFGGDLRASLTHDPTPYYAFDGLIDELRLSSVARTKFESVRP
jgi:hypothetical protein